MSHDSRARRVVAGDGIGFRLVRQGRGVDIFKAGKGAAKFRERHPQLYARLLELRKAEAEKARIDAMFDVAGDI